MQKKISIIITYITLCMLLVLWVPTDVYAVTASDTSDHWASTVIQDWIEEGYIEGYTDGSFKPDNNISRAEFITLINKVYGYTGTSPVSFSDVQESDWCYNAVAAALAKGYISGYMDGTMRPDDPISREEVATIFMNINNLQADPMAAHTFKDHVQMGWSKAAIGAVAEAKIMSGYPDGSFLPGNYITRGEAIVSLDRANEYASEAVTPSAPNLTLNDDKNTVMGMTTEMEYKLDSADWVQYDPKIFDAIDLSGDHIMLVRYAAIGNNPYGPSITLTFTKNQPTGGGGGSPSTNIPDSINIESVAITGTVKVGDELTAEIEPEGATADYQWQISETVDGTYADIAGANSNKYVPALEDAGKFVRVTATGTGSYMGTLTSSTTDAVEDEDMRLYFTVPTARGTYFPDMGYSNEEVNQIMTALWGEQDTTIAGVDIKPIFSTSGDGNILIINTDNITQSLLDWLEHDLATKGNIALGINFSRGISTTESDDNLINGSDGTSLLNLLVDYPDWEGTTVRVNLHKVKAGTNYGSIVTSGGPIDFQVLTNGRLIPANSIEITNGVSTITVDDGVLKMTAGALPTDAYDQTVIWSVVDVTGVARISNSGHGTTGNLYAGKDGTVEVYATSAYDKDLVSEAFVVTISNQRGPAAPTGVGKTDETIEGANDGTLTGVSPDMEYQVNGEGDWIPITGNTVTGLAPGSYTVRLAETEIAYAGDATKPLIIAAGGKEITE